MAELGPNSCPPDATAGVVSCFTTLPSLSGTIHSLSFRLSQMRCASLLSSQGYYKKEYVSMLGTCVIEREVGKWCYDCIILV